MDNRYVYRNGNIAFITSNWKILKWIYIKKARITTRDNSYSVPNLSSNISMIRDKPNRTKPLNVPKNRTVATNCFCALAKSMSVSRIGSLSMFMKVTNEYKQLIIRINTPTIFIILTISFPPKRLFFLSLLLLPYFVVNFKLF